MIISTIFRRLFILFFLPLLALLLSPMIQAEAKKEITSCSSCYKNINPKEAGIVTTECNHTFHYECFKKDREYCWPEEDVSSIMCPTCYEYTPFLHCSKTRSYALVNDEDEFQLTTYPCETIQLSHTEMARHERQHHIPCHICKKIMNRADWKRHGQQLHTSADSATPYKCSLCPDPRLFTQIDELKQHIHRNHHIMHLRNKKTYLGYQCACCLKQFQRKGLGLLARHITAHGETLGSKDKELSPPHKKHPNTNAYRTPPRQVLHHDTPDSSGEKKTFRRSLFNTVHDIATRAFGLLFGS